MIKEQILSFKEEYNPYRSPWPQGCCIQQQTVVTAYKKSAMIEMYNCKVQYLCTCKNKSKYIIMIFKSSCHRQLTHWSSDMVSFLGLHIKALCQCRKRGPRTFMQTSVARKPNNTREIHNLVIHVSVLESTNVTVTRQKKKSTGLTSQPFYYYEMVLLKFLMYGCFQRNFCRHQI